MENKKHRESSGKLDTDMKLLFDVNKERLEELIHIVEEMITLDPVELIDALRELRKARIIKTLDYEFLLMYSMMMRQRRVTENLVLTKLGADVEKEFKEIIHDPDKLKKVIAQAQDRLNKI